MSNYLYLLVRTDMTSQGRGKGMAQASHAANAFTFDHIIQPALSGSAPNSAAVTWCYEAKGFGTAIVLGCNLSQLEQKIAGAISFGFAASLVIDPEYHIVDGPTHHIVPNVITSGYIFGDKVEMYGFLKDLSLMPNDPV